MSTTTTSLAALALLSVTACVDADSDAGVGDDPTADGATGITWVRTPSGTFEASYVVVGGDAIIEGDINLGPIEDILDTFRGGAVNAGAFWTGGHVKFAFDPDFAPGTCSGSASDPNCVCNDGTCLDVRTVVRDVMADLDARLPLDIEEIAYTETGNVIIFEYDETEGQGSSQVGMQSGPQAIKFATPDVEKAAKQPTAPTLRHEMLHALGLFHEQSRTDRDLYITVNDECIQDDQEDQYDSHDESKDVGPYDFNSLVHYSPRTFCEKKIDPQVCDCDTMTKNVSSSVPWPESTEDLSAEDVVTLHRMYLRTEGLNEAGDMYGDSIAIGDFDADGYDDVAIGAPFDDRDALDTGAVYLYRGTYRGLLFWRAIGLPELGVPVELRAKVGDALVAGRFDDDEFVDLAIGAPGLIVSGVSAGGVFVLHGSRSGPVHRRTITEASPVPFTVDSGDRFGATLAAGDLANQGYDALIIGAPNDKSDAGFRTGAVYVYQADPGGDVLYKPSRVDNYMSEGSEMGAALATGDLDGDANVDLAIGEPGYDGGKGLVLMVSGVTPNGPPALWGPMFQLRPVLSGVETGGRFGAAVAIGNLSLGNSGKPELAIGVPGYNAGRGKVRIREVASNYTTTLWGDLVDTGTTINAMFGAALAIGDVDRTTTAPDLVIGEPGFSSNRGRLFVINGGTAASVTIDQAGLNDNDPNDRFGTTLAVGHVDGWGLIAHTDEKAALSRNLDLLVGAVGEQPEGKEVWSPEDPAAGAVMTFFGRSGTQPLYDRQWHQEFVTGHL